MVNLAVIGEIHLYLQSADILTRNCFAIVALTVYDYILTFRDERAYVWNKQFTGATLIFFINRYFMLASVLFLCSTFATSQTDLVSPSSPSA